MAQFADLVTGYMNARDLVFADDAGTPPRSESDRSSPLAPVVDHPRADESLGEATARARAQFKSFREGPAQPLGPDGMLALWRELGSPRPSE